MTGLTVGLFVVFLPKLMRGSMLILRVGSPERVIPLGRTVWQDRWVEVWVVAVQLSWYPPAESGRGRPMPAHVEGVM